MSGNIKRPREMTRNDYEKATERYWKKIEPWFESVQVKWILEDMDRQREAMKEKEGGTK
jgi:glycerol kinase